MSYGKTGGFWKRPVNRVYHYNFQVGENYYQPMTRYLDSKYTGMMPTTTMAEADKVLAAADVMGGKVDTPGALSFSERLAQRWITGRTDYANYSYSSQSHTAATTTAGY